MRIYMAGAISGNLKPFWDGVAKHNENLFGRRGR